ncbi:hypothetical protein LV716_15345 [Flagellimonas sp. HMM57]|uniref:hypothetical protein n=1 Tax=unclassified Flagellimonas TaxID=2644544 RepID=UPI0013D1A5C6|nr:MULTISPECIES: hypothetical protein [unclassified Flagellimonas]UII75620.1 hypothetical protein LV716_15345 [Flagellimonas sp. HMM57]
MKKILLIGTLIVLAACGGVKKTQKNVNSGDYNTAIETAIKNLTANKNKKGHQPFILLLEDAFAKNVEREEEQIAFLQKDGNPANLESIYNKYLRLKEVQKRIRPLMPLFIKEQGRNASFKFANYDARILNTKDKLSEHLYTSASNLLVSATNKQDYRTAYSELKYLEDINPNYRETVAKMNDAYRKGLEYVRVDINNDTEQIIPERLEEELLDFNTFGINDFWIEYHSNPLSSIKYDYALNLNFMEINISPEQVNEKQIIKEKQIKDGYEYLLDPKGNAVKDSLGNRIKVDKFRTVKCNFYQFTQFKAAQIGAKVSFTDLASGQEINSYPLSSEFIFENIYANYKGDKRALDTDLIPLLEIRAIAFPSNEQMVYDAGEDLKQRLKAIISRNQFN